MKTALAFLLLIVVILVLRMPFLPGEKPVAQPVAGLPWQIEVLPEGGSRVFELTLARSTLAEARQRFGRDMEIAVVAAPGEPGALEAYLSSVTAGVIMGKIILVADVRREIVAQLRQRAINSEYMDSSTRKYILHPDDLDLAWRAPIAGITFIPATSIDEQTVLGRFGVPGERIRIDARVEHFLYPDKGLDLALDSRGKEVLQYIAPRQFARLREPLVRASIANTRDP